MSKLMGKDKIQFYTGPMVIEISNHTVMSLLKITGSAPKLICLAPF